MTRLFDKVSVTDAAGYCGGCLVPQPPDRSYKVTIYGIVNFGDTFLPKSNPSWG